MGLGLSVTVVEAANRIGGRCWTDTETFGIPYDVGAHWLHFSANNFYVPYGQENGFSLYPDCRKFHLFQNDQELAGGFSRITSTWELYEQVIDDAAGRGIDTSLADATRNIEDSNKPTVESLLGPWIMGKEVGEISVMDHASGMDGTDWFCREGFGALVAHYGSALPISLNTQVSHIDWSAEGVKLTTGQGTMHAQAVIVTVSTGVLASGNIRFIPELPILKQESFQNIAMGCYEHVVLQFKDGNFFSEPDSYIIRMVEPDRGGFGTLANVCGTGLAYCDIGGDNARQLVAQGETACIDYALGELSSVIGSEVTKQFIKGVATAWLHHPYSEGSYAGAKPGCYHLREALRESVGDRIFFAGEACHPNMWATVAGAHESGRLVANEVGHLVN